MNHPTLKPSAIEPLQASAQELGCDIAEAELADGLMVQLPADLVSSQLPEIEPEDFETSYMWFLS